MSHRDHYDAFFPELCEQDPKYGVVIPPWHTIEAQGVAVRDVLLKERDKLLAEGRAEDLPSIGGHNPHHRSYGTVVDNGGVPLDKFDVHNINCFNALPTVVAIRDAIADSAASGAKSFVRPWEVDEVRDQARHEMAHTLYHHVMWRRYGRKVYVLDETTYHLLANTPLPDLPASILCAPAHSFYLVLPRSAAYKFGVWNLHEHREDKQEVEGILVTTDNIDPDSPKPREIAFMSVGISNTKSTQDRNIAFISITLGPDALLSDVRVPADSVYGPHHADDTDGAVPEGQRHINRSNAFATGLRSGSYELGVVTPRVIIGFLLYLMSEHPDIEPIDPAPRRNFKDIKSPKQREAALRNQATKLKDKTRLPILYIGRKLAEEIAEQRRTLAHDALQSARSGTSRQLDHPVWVRGHWKQQPYGEGRKLRKMIWIRPYLKGPDAAESLKIRASKIQTAQPAKEKRETPVTKLESA